MAGELLVKISAEIDARLAELRPALAEYERLISAAEALELPVPAAGTSPRRSTSAKRAGSPQSRTTAAPKATRRRAAGPRGSAAGTIVRAASPPGRERKAPGARSVRPRAVRGAAQQAILAALEHGSHTVGELAVVTAMSGQSIRENLRRMLGAGAVTRAKREGKAAYALAGRAGH
jgi:hypothetical protein